MVDPKLVKLIENLESLRPQWAEGIVPGDNIRTGILSDSMSLRTHIGTESLQLETEY